MKLKRIIAGLTVMSVLFCFGITSLANNNIDVSKEFNTTNSNFNYEFEKEISKESKKYVLNESSIKYEIIEQKTDTQKLEQTIKKENIKVKDENIFEKTLIQDDKTYNLDDIVWSSSLGDTRKTTATGEINYTYSSTPPSPSSTHTFNYVDVEDNNKVIPVSLNFVSLTNSTYTWLDDFVVDVEVIGVDNPYYIFNNKLIPKNEAYPLLQGYEQDYLTYLGLNSNSYKLTGSEWIGEPYTATDGIVKRKARFTGIRYVATFTANYSSEVELPQLEELTAKATYVYEDIDNSTTTYTVKAFASYDEVVENEKTIIAISIGLILLLGFIIFMLFFAKKNKKEEDKNA